MARNIKPSDMQTDEVVVESPGGSPGIPDDPNPMAMAVGGPKVNPPVKAPEPRVEQPARRFKVIDGPGRADVNGGFRAMYGGALTTVRLGSVYSEHQMDLDALRNQGFKFKELAAPVAE